MISVRKLLDPHAPLDVRAERIGMRSTIHVCVVLVALVLSGPIRGQETPVRYIDHIMIRSDMPDELFAFFSEMLQLPIAWPLSDRGGVVSGGIGFGNVNVEAIKFPGQIKEPAPTHLVGLALKPSSLDQSLRELERRGIAYGAPRPFVSRGPGGVRVTFFTNVTLLPLSDADRPAHATIHVFLSEYNPAYVDAVARRDRLRDELAAKRGGPLGLVRVQQVIIGTTDLKKANRTWEKLVAPSPAAGVDLWQIGDGPAVRLVQAERDILQGLVLAVAALPGARNFLEERGLLGATSETELSIAPSKVHGLSIRIIADPRNKRQ
jgi:hypothetical protein